MMLNGREVDRKVSANLSSNMESLHLETVGAKVYASEHAARGIELARLICGGHGNPEDARISIVDD
jgi:acyl-CoA oxidase